MLPASADPFPAPEPRADEDQWDANLRANRYKNYAWYSVILQLALSILWMAYYGYLIGSTHSIQQWGSKSVGWSIISMSIVIFVFAIAGLIGIWSSNAYLIGASAVEWAILSATILIMSIITLIFPSHDFGYFVLIPSILITGFLGLPLVYLQFRHALDLNPCCACCAERRVFVLRTQRVEDLAHRVQL